MSGAPARRRVAPLETARPGAQPAPLPARPLAAANPAGGAKALTKEELAAYAQQRKAEREREREERAAQLRAAKLAAASKLAGDGALSSRNPGSGTVSAGAHTLHTAHLPGRSSQGSQAGSQPARHPAASSSSSGGSVSGGKQEGRRSISSTAPVTEHATARPAAGTLASAQQQSQGEEPSQLQQQQQLSQQPAMQMESSSSQRGGSRGGGGGGKWSPRKLPRAQQLSTMRGSAAGAGPAPAAARQGLPAKPSSRPDIAAQIHASSRVPPLALGKLAGSTTAGPAPLRSARPAAPSTAAVASLAGPATARPAFAVRPAADGSAELDSAELDARRTQQLVDWGTLLVQSTAVVAAERLLLGTAAPPDSAAPCADQLPISYGVQPPAEPAARCAAVQAQVAAALEALEQHRQLKVQLATQEGLPEAERRLLLAEAAADLQAQALLAHWGTQAAREARAQERQSA